MLTEAVGRAHLVNYLYTMINMEKLGLGVLVFTPFIVVLCSMVGIHPMVSVVIVGQVFMTAQTVIPPAGIALVLLLGAEIAFIASPLAGIVLTAAKFVNRSSTQIAWQWNGLFSVLFFMEGLLFIYFWISIVMQELIKRRQHMLLADK